MPVDPNIPHQDTTYQVIGAAMRIHTRLGPGLKERHYQHALSKELQCSGLTSSEEYPVEIFDGDRWLGRLYLDLHVEDCVVVETKAFSHMLTKQ